MLESDRDFAWRLNEREAHHIVSQTFEAFSRVCSVAALAAVATIGSTVAGFILAMREDVDYDSDNVRWFRARYGSFVYIDRVAVTDAYRQRGVGRALYREAECFARGHGVGILCCEVNANPPNPRSVAFHETLGFRRVGTHETRGKTVTMLVKSVGR